MEKKEILIVKVFVFLIIGTLFFIAITDLYKIVKLEVDNPTQQKRNFCEQELNGKFDNTIPTSCSYIKDNKYYNDYIQCVKDKCGTVQ